MGKILKHIATQPFSAQLRRPAGQEFNIPTQDN